VTGPRRRGLGLRERLLLAFVLVAVPPLLVLTVAVNTLIGRSFETEAARRLQSGLDAAHQRLVRLQGRAADQLAAVARVDLSLADPTEPTAAGEPPPLDLAHHLAQQRDLEALEVVDREGRILSSHHWPAGLGLQEADERFPGDDALRVATVAEGYGHSTRLALMPARPAAWHGHPVTLRGGAFLDRDFLSDLWGLTGLEVGFHDRLHGRWFAPEGSHLPLWVAPDLQGTQARGEVPLGGESYQWAAMAVHPSLWLVVATPRTPLVAVRGSVRSLSIAIGVGSLGAALAFAFLLSGRIARPVGELAAGARRVAAGDLTSSVAAATEDEIGDLARAFNAMTGELLESRERLLQMERVAAWREMARRLAHELKNPLFPIQVSIETLRRAYEQGRDFPALFHESSDTILEELRSLRKIIDEFSEFARMPRPRLGPLDLNAVVEQVLGLYQARAAGFQVERELAPDLPPVSADRDLLARALGNLVANALEAMGEGGTLRLRTQRRDGAVAVEVEDTGPGLDDEQRTRLFTPYFTTKKGGTGLGLAIVQGIVSDHGGRVEVRSTRGSGTTFTLILPASSGYP
jgi:nitrogen fixation/metabolism regulation signal transduction histidine kinase